MAAGKCPKCERIVDRVLFEEVNAEQYPRGNAWITVNFLCPYCRTVLGAQIDPFALKRDLLDELEQHLQKVWSQ